MSAAAAAAAAAAAILTNGVCSNIESTYNTKRAIKVGIDWGRRLVCMVTDRQAPEVCQKQKQGWLITQQPLPASRARERPPPPRATTKTVGGGGGKREGSLSLLYSTLCVTAQILHSDNFFFSDTHSGITSALAKHKETPARPERSRSIKGSPSCPGARSREVNTA
jgi:hypothetical protein